MVSYLGFSCSRVDTSSDTGKSQQVYLALWTNSIEMGNPPAVVYYIHKRAQTHKSAYKKIRVQNL